MHDPASVTCQVGPALSVTGFADGEFLTYGFDVANDFEAVPGVGVTGHVKSSNRAGFIQIVLHWKAPAQILAKLNAMRASSAAPGANIAFKVVVADLSGLSIVTLEGARFQSRAAGSYSTTGPSTRTFRFHGVKLTPVELGYVEV